jgi:class 3 adenylate cyclase/PAS domain-containing protein
MEFVDLYVDSPRLLGFLQKMALGMLRLSALGVSGFTGLPAYNLTANPDTGEPLVVNDLAQLYETFDGVVNAVRMIGDERHGLSRSSDDMIDWMAKPMCTVPFESTDMQRIRCQSMEQAMAFTIRQVLRALDVTTQNVRGLVGFPSEGPRLAVFGLYNYVSRSVLHWALSSCSVLYVSQLDYAREMFIGQAMRGLNAVMEESGNLSGMQAAVIVCTVLVAFCGLLFIPAMLRMGEGALASLRLLMFCPPAVVLQAVPIQKVLSNDFSGVDEHEADDSHFFESVVSHLLDAVLFVATDLTVISANHAVEAVLGLAPGSVIGKSLTSLFTAAEDSPSLAGFFSLVNGALNGQRAPAIDADVEILRESKLVTLKMRMLALAWSGHVQLQAINGQGIAILAFLIRDVTSAVAADKLLREEGVKSEKLLLMILPPIIVKKLQNGEKNISFAVKSASILFLDIVSFTPWCGSHDASYVMSTLNRLFLEYDRLLKARDRLTKIKCIGDCYMCGGGLFDIVNQPQIHAEQMVSFGLDVIHALQLVNIDLSESLRIRVGVNTGGPLVAGVLGIEKPTFDILGPAICLGAAMEHHGIPMTVHIPKQCYDLVYGSHFIIQERGDVEHKGKVYHTYLVTGYKQD